MGLFDIFKSITDEVKDTVTTKLAEEVKENLTSKITGEIKGSAASKTLEKFKGNAAQFTGTNSKSLRSRTELINDFKKLFSEHFSEYNIRYEVSASSLDAFAHPACTPIQFLFEKDGKAVLAAVIVRPNTYRGMNVVATKDVCDNRGIRYLRFFEDMPNEDTYVVNRIKENL